MSSDSDREFMSISSEEDTEENSKEDSGEKSVILDPDEKESYKLRLIKEVKKNQALWDIRCRNNRNVDLKCKLWKEVASKLHPESWSVLSDKEQDIKGKNAYNTWKNMKDVFRRYIIKVQKGIKVRRYRYSKQLKFLVPIIESTIRKPALKRESSEDKKPDKSDYRGNKRPKRSRNELASNQVSPATTSNARGDAPPRQPSSDLASCKKSVGTSTRDDALSMTTSGTSMVPENEPSGSNSGFAKHVLSSERGLYMTSLEAAHLELLQALLKKESDEDRDFASSLVPMLRELDYDRKHYAKIQILNVMKNARYWVPDASIDLPGPVEEDGRRTPIAHDMLFLQSSTNERRTATSELRLSSDSSESESNDDTVHM